MNDKPKIWVTEPIHPDAMAALRAQADVIGHGPATSEERAQISAIIVRTLQVDAALLATLPRLAVVGKHGAGTDNIDSKALEAAGIELHSAAGQNAESVADLAVGLALMLLRQPDLHDRSLRDASPAPGVSRIGFELSEVSIGILGLGAIGRKVAHRLHFGFGARVSAYDPALPAQSWPADVQRHESLSALLSASRLLFVHLPLLPATRGLIGAAELAQMPKGSFIVNCARGGILREEALADALREGQLAGAASDVFETEPPSPQNPLFDGLRFIGTPHIGASTHAALHRTGLHIVGKVLTALTHSKTKQGN